MLSKIGRFKGLPPKTQAYVSSKDQGEVESASKTESLGFDFAQLNADEIIKLKNFPRTIQDGVYSLA